ncbi:MAG: glycoside hydrolase family 6 protein, partial [Pseudonocardia sp.]|nr:glycoside hydrolase family 6 protein [Pseudonocardia sp.]
MLLSLRGRALLAALAALLALAGGACAAPATVVAPGASAVPAGSATDLFVDPDTAAARQVRQWLAEGRAADAQLLRKIAEQPVPNWLTKPAGEVGDEVRDYVAKARAAGQRPYFVTYHIPGRDCGSYSGGGAGGEDEYRRWFAEVADAVRGSNALIVVEPDAVPQTISCGKGAERLDLLADSVAALKAAGATVYLDAGNPGFIDDTGRLVDALQRAGVGQADGFSLNVANFHPTRANIAFGKELSAALGGKHFVIDTSRNGNGAVDEHEINGGPSWCNPPGRALG